MPTDINISFDHGLGDCANAARLLQLYKRRGIRVAVEHDPAMSLVWRAAKLDAPPSAIPTHHEWLHGPWFNRPMLYPDWVGNKVADNIGRYPLPQIGSVADLWDELCAISMDGGAEEYTDSNIRRRVAEKIDRLPKPIVLIHAAGGSDASFKNLSDDVQRELLCLLMNGMEGTVIALGPAAGRFTHPRLGRLNSNSSLDALAALMDQADLLIGIDSGPYHFAALTKIPVLGVFHDFYPTTVAIPRAQTVNMTRAAARQLNTARRRRWNILEYEGQYPKASDVALHAIRMLSKSRYGLPLSQDVVFQQWLTDDGLQPATEAQSALDELLVEVGRRFTGAHVVELGNVCESDVPLDRSVGYILAAFLHAKRSGYMTVVSESDEQRRLAGTTVGAWDVRASVRSERMTPCYGKNRRAVDVLYVHGTKWAHDLFADWSAKNDLLFSQDAIVLLERTRFDGAWRGPYCDYVVPLLRDGWRVVSSTGNAILSRTSSVPRTSLAAG